jgi:hypothetical protein
MIVGANFPGETRGIVFQQTDVAVPRDKIDTFDMSDRLLACLSGCTAGTE